MDSREPLIGNLCHHDTRGLLGRNWRSADKLQWKWCTLYNCWQCCKGLRWKCLQLHTVTIVLASCITCWLCYMLELVAMCREQYSSWCCIWNETYHFSVFFFGGGNLTWKCGHNVGTVRCLKTGCTLSTDWVISHCYQFTTYPDLKDVAMSSSKAHWIPLDSDGFIFQLTLLNLNILRQHFNLVRFNNWIFFVNLLLSLFC